jgi:putative SOS response-associated peptidase YedK
MCYFNSINLNIGDIIKISNKEKKINKKIQSNITSGFEYTQWPIIKEDHNSADLLLLEMAHWEFIPSWIHNTKELELSREKFTTLNAKGENLLESKMYRDASLKRRCIVLSSGFYEWRHYKPVGSKKENAYPYFITIKGKPVFFMAGIYQPWTDKNTGETIDSFAIVTTTANDLMSKVHNKKKRMPAILNESLATEWLQEGLNEKRINEIANFQLAAEDMEAHSIRKDFKITANPQEKFVYAELPLLDESKGFSNELPFV